MLRYAQKQTPKNLSLLRHPPIKDTGYFQKAYALHDLASTYVIHQYLQRKYTIFPIGVDLRQRRVIIENEVPDYLAERGKELFCFDVKSKTSLRYFGWVNERAVRSYRELVNECNISVYLIFVHVVQGKVGMVTGYSDVCQHPKVKDVRAWNGNRVWIFDWKEGLP